MSSGPELPSGTVTFLFTDIEGSTRLLKQLRDGYARVLAEHQELLRTAFAAHRGQVVDTQGDSFFVAFRRAGDAVDAAAVAQRALSSHAWPEGVEVRVRMGIHTGQAEASDGRYHGLAVHRAARIGAAAHGGQVLVSQTTRDLLDDEEEESAGIALRDLGEQRLKDLDRPVRLYQLDVEGLPSEFPPLRTAAPEADGEQSVAAVSSRRRRLRLLAPVVVVAVGGAVAAGVLLTRGSSGSAQAAGGVAADSVGVFDAGSGKLIAQAPVRTGPSAVAYGEGSVWVTNVNDDSVSRIDPTTHVSVQTIQVGNGPSGIAVGGGFVWVANSLDGTVWKIDPRANGGAVVDKIEVGNGPSGVAFGAGSLWVANSADHSIVRLDPLSGKVGRPISVATGADGITVGAGALWVTSETAGSVARVDPPTASVVQTINVGSGAAAVAVGGPSVWVANRDGATVSRIDAASGEVKSVISVGAGPSSIAVAPSGKTVWVSNELDGTLSRIDPSRNAVVKTIPIGNRPEGIALTGATMYVAVRTSGAAHRGGTLTRLNGGKIGQSYRSEADAIDPARGYAAWELLILTNDGLVTYKRAGGAASYGLEPDLATALPIPTDGGRTYIFRLRSGIRYSTGALVRPADFRRGIERALLLSSGGVPGAYFSGIVGADACVNTKQKRCDLSKGIVVNAAANTLTFHLSAPDPDFLYKLALPNADAVPAKTPLNARLPVPATGPYMIASYDGKHGVIRLVRNPRFHVWALPAQPDGFPDEIVERYGYSDDARLHAVEQGKADVTGVPGDSSRVRLAALRTRYAGQLHGTPVLGTTWFWLHTKVPPFDDVRVRRAVSYAIDRNQLVKLAGGLAQPSCQVLPPSFPGYRRSCSYTIDPSPDGKYHGPDLAKAKELVAASGTKGMTVSVWTVKGFFEGPPTYLVSVLRSLGYKARLHAVHGSAFGAVADSRRNVQADGPFPWATDYPTPSGFFSPFLTCATFRPGTTDNSNWGEFCDPRIDAEIARALSLQTSDPQAAALLWRKVDRDVVNQAPVVPFFNPQKLELVSSRVGNYTNSFLATGALLDQLWVR